MSEAVKPSRRAALTAALAAGAAAIVPAAGAVAGNAAKTPRILGNEAWSTGQRLYLAQAAEGRFDVEKYGLQANPYPKGSRDHLGWENGWSAAFDEYLTAVYG